MANQTAKTQKSKPAKPEAPISSTTSAATPESKPNSDSKPNALLGRSLSPVTADTRRAMIAEAAYYIAEQRGFGSDREVEDWLLAEKQVEAALSA
ncbi:MAG: DUF2934 domain-containing protein [Gammaproteobacteria bacterium]|nr:DUF2934 domain-containing protein [Gammaproteobacteria bacterium]MDE2261559.1 DUF2934 domain-containing protein [Gammaproteobacteria bacterium]